jgi:3-oxoacyl-[acyl-carrier-protein] synthase-3
MERTEEEGGILAQHFGTDGDGGLHLYRSGLSSTLQGTQLTGNGKLMQNGREVYRFAVGKVPKGIRALLEEVKWGVEQIDWFIPHSANLRIIESLCEKTGIPLSKALHCMEYFGNTAAASIPIALDAAAASSRVKAGDHLLLYGFGGGFTYGGILLRWTLQPPSTFRKLVSLQDGTTI